VFDAPIMAHARWGVRVVSLHTGEVLYELNPRRLMMPASNMKIVTLAGAANVLGWDYRFTTTLETDAPVEGETLRGDLYVRGGGDPTINRRNGRAAAVFAEWTAALKAAGIRRIAGRVIGDDQTFDDERLGAGWAWDYLEAGYAAPVGALEYNEDAAELTVAPAATAGEPAVVRLSAGSGLTVINRAVTGATGVAETIEFRRRLDTPVLEVTGTVPLPDANDTASAPVRTVTRQVAVVNPTLYFVQSFKDALESAGVEVEGDAVDFDDVAASLVGSMARRVLATAESPPLRDIAIVLMKVSQNLYAETLMKAAGTAGGGLGTVPAGRAAILSALRGWIRDEQALVMADGSGLSRYNYVTPDLLVRILGRMYSDPRHRDPFLATLPIGGKDGTLAARMRRTRAEGNARAKTGSISNVRALSGYVHTRDGEMLAFSILANDFVIPAATVSWIADLAVEVLANFTRGARTE
jgi:D-alanyl-D-alanine carboxypeptidase/D-alanyl-D-alanine-endopeptidase (penicillin-binding protein 4)